MKEKLAMFISPDATNNENARPMGTWAEGFDDYIRVTDYMLVDFPARAASEYVPDQVNRLRAKSDEIRDVAATKMQSIEDAISKLEVLEHLPSDA